MTHTHEASNLWCLHVLLPSAVGFTAGGTLQHYMRPVYLMQKDGFRRVSRLRTTKLHYIPRCVLDPPLIQHWEARELALPSHVSPMH